MTGALFIDVEVAPSVVHDRELAAKLAEVCPVDIFHAGEHGVEIVEENLDECVLCELCLNASPPGAVRVMRLYDRGSVLGGIGRARRLTPRRAPAAVGRRS